MIIKEFHLKISRASETLGPALAMFSGRVSQKSPFSTLFLCNSWITQSDPVLQIYNPCSFKLLLFWVFLISILLAQPYKAILPWKIRLKNPPTTLSSTVRVYLDLSVETIQTIWEYFKDFGEDSSARDRFESGLEQVNSSARLLRILGFSHNHLFRN